MDDALHIPLVFSHSDFNTNGFGLVVIVFPFFFGRPMTVRPAPLGRPRFLIFGGIFTTRMLSSILPNGFGEDDEDASVHA